MSEDIRAGDVVVLVDDRRRGVGITVARGFMVRGRHYRVAAVGHYGWCGLQLVGDPANITFPRGFWPADRFRKLDAAEDCFTKAMQQLVPNKIERVAARGVRS